MSWWGKLLGGTFGYLLAGPLADGGLDDADLDKVRRRRLWPTQATQFVQVLVQDRIISPLLADRETAPKPPLPLRMIASSPFLQRRAAQLIGMGVRPEHVSSPERHRPVAAAA